MSSCTCPLCGDYEDEPASVEAHISSRTDDLHSGSVGEHYREDLAEDAAGGDRPAAATSSGATEELAERGETTGLSGLDVGPGTAVLVATVVVALVVVFETAAASDDQPEASGEDVDDGEGEVEASAGGMLA